jgi:hypothetical protein
MIFTTLAWTLATIIYAQFYVSRRISLPGSEGYERLWNWQLVFFLITRFPFLLCALGAALCIEYLLFRNSHDSASSLRRSGFSISPTEIPCEGRKHEDGER